MDWNLAKEHNGRGATVGVIDYGANLNLPCFKGVSMEYMEFGEVERMHGTHVCSTIAAIAPNARMLVAGGVIKEYAVFNKMLEWLCQRDIDVLNLSLAARQYDFATERMLSMLVARGCLVIAAYNPRLPYPCGYKGVVKAGKGGELETPFSNFAYGTDGRLREMRGNSVSAAIASGIAALCKGCNKAIGREEFILAAKEYGLSSCKPGARLQTNLEI